MSQDTVRVPNSSSSPAGVVHAPSSKAALVLGALGVVYGDIGTSPLYTLRACLTGLSVHTDLEPAHLLGVLSILFWMLMVVVSFKYVMLVLRADNRGEGGTLALLELAVRGREGRMRWVLIVLGIFGAALFYGDSMITPAISVLSALEGIGIVSHQLDEWVAAGAAGAGGPVRDSVARHWPDGQAVRSCDGAVVRHAGAAGRLAGLADAGSAQCAQSHVGLALHR